LLCACGGPHPITIASKNFTEQIILGEMAAQQLERKLHITVRRRLNLGGTLLAHEAIRRGDVDVYPEYTGTGASVVLKQPVPPDPAQAYLAVKEAYLRRFQLVWLPPLGFNDTFAMAVRASDGKQLSSPDLSAAAARGWRLGIGYEFLTRPDGLTRLNQVYGFKWQGTPKSMDLGLLYRALAQNRVDMAAGNSTDAQLSDPAIMALRDDRKAFPPYNACFIARQDLLGQRPEVRMALTLLANRIDDQTMRTLNRRVEVDHQRVERVVADFLATQP
jgi:glycine betaine/choline ABC-type transport system substrate-binding protein